MTTGIVKRTPPAFEVLLAPPSKNERCRARAGHYAVVLCAVRKDVLVATDVMRVDALCLG